MFTGKTVNEFTEALASGSPAPGGGSAAALAGALAASLAAMVCNLTIGRDRFKDHDAEMKEILSKVECLREELVELVNKDTDAFMGVMSAFKLPKESEGQKNKRTMAIQEAFKHAAELPLRACRSCRQILQVSAAIVEHGNPNAISDAGVCALLAGAGARGAALNVRTNTGSITDVSVKGILLAELDEIMSSVVEMETRVLARLDAKIDN